MLIQQLHAIQARHGFLPDDELTKLAKDNGVSLSRVEEISTYYPEFRLERSGLPAVSVQVCRDMACHLRGAPALLDEARGLPATACSLTAVEVRGVSCLGRCDRAPVVRVERRPVGLNGPAQFFAGRSLDNLTGVVTALAAGEKPAADPDVDYQTHSNRRYTLPIVEPDDGLKPIPVPNWSFDPYGPNPRDYRAVRLFIGTLSTRPLIAPPREIGGRELDAHVQQHHPLLWELRRSNLLGMGGAGAPTYQKWLDVWRELSREKYIVCNGSDSEPATFKDREILLRAPHIVVEGIILAGLMTGATAGFIAIRYEHAEQIAALRAEIQRAVQMGVCGKNILKTGRDFTVEVFEIPGGYICGEQSALIEVMEDRRGQPRNRPPELTTNGLHDKPTVVNNVETLAWVPQIVLYGGTGYARGWSSEDGTARFFGKRLFAVSGDVVRPGVYQVPVGLPLSDLLYGRNYCEGIRGGLRLKAIAPSGSSGGFLPARLPVDPKLDERKRADVVAHLRERSPLDAANMDWFLRTHFPLGAAELDVLALPLDLNFFRHLQGLLRLQVEPLLGAGIFVCAEGTDILDMATNVTAFYARETCGKCLPCRLGAPQLAALGSELLARRSAGPLNHEDVRDAAATVNDLMKTLQLTSICGLGYIAPIPLATALTYFAGDICRKPV